MMKRAFLVFGLIMLAAFGSAEERVWRLGVLTPFDWPADTSMHSVMLPELARRGFVEGRNLVVLPRWGSDADLDKLNQLAQDLAAAKPDVVIAVSPGAVEAAMKAAPQTPIVASFTTDPVTEGEAASMSRPGGKVTGIAMLSFEGDRKRVELLHEAIPTAHKFGYLTYKRAMKRTDDVRRTAASLGVEIISYEANSSSDYRQPSMICAMLTLKQLSLDRLRHFIAMQHNWRRSLLRDACPRSVNGGRWLHLAA